MPLPWHEPIEQVRAAMTERLGGVRAQRVHAPEDRQSAVLVAVIERSPEPTLLMVQKRADLPRHAGQMAFPGGRIEDDDTDSRAAALREAYEEVGLPPDNVEILGALDDHRTFVSSYHIRPWVAWVRRPPGAWRLDEREIARVVEVPLRAALEQAPASWLHWRWAEHHLRAPRWRFGDDVIVWGASARILHDLRGRLSAPDDALR